MHRNWMALYANSNRDSKKQPKPFQPKDFFPLADDKEEEEQREPINPEEVKQKSIDITKARKRKRNG